MKRDAFDDLSRLIDLGYCFRRFGSLYVLERAGTQIVARTPYGLVLAGNEPHPRGRKAS